MFGFGIPELLILLAIILVVFGAGKLPEIGTALGKTLHNFKRIGEDKEEIAVKPKAGPDDGKVG